MINISDLISNNEIRLVQLRETKPSLVSFRTIRYSKKKLMQNIVLDYFPNRKVTKTNYINRFGGESFLEDILLVLLEHESNVLMYLPQSLPFYPGEEAKKLAYYIDNTNEEWTPDNASLWTNFKPLVIEVKSKKWILSLTPDQRIKLFSKWEQSRSYLQARNIEFLVFTDDFNTKSWRVDNLIDLESQMRFSKKHVEDAILNLFLLNPNENFTVKKLQDIFEEINILRHETTSAVCSLIYYGKLYINLDEEFRLDKTFIVASTENNSEISLRSWLESYKFNWEEFIVDDESNNNGFIFNKSDYTQHQLQTKDENEKIIEAIKRGIYYLDILKKFNISYGKFYNLKRLYEDFCTNRISDIDFQKKIIPLKPVGRNKTELFSIDEEGDITFYDEIFQESLNMCLEQKNRLNLESSWVYYKTFKRKEAFSLGLTIRRNENLFILIELSKVKDNGFFHATYNIYRDEYNRYCQTFQDKITCKREGLRQAKKESMIVTGTTPWINFIGQMGQFDHSIADIINNSAISVTMFVEYQKLLHNHKYKRHYLERPTVSTIEDIHTRVILACIIRYRKPSIESDFQCIRRMVIGNINPLLSFMSNKKSDQDAELLRNSTIAKIMRGVQELTALGILPQEEYDSIKLEFNEGNPENLREIAEWWDNIRVMPYLMHMDNGRDFTSEEFQKWMEKSNVNTAYRPVGGSQYGGHIERLFGTLNRKAFHNMTGNTKGSISERKNYKSENLAILTFEQLEAILLLSIIRYHATPSKEDNISPRERWRQSYEINGHNFHFLPSGKLESLDEKTKTSIKQLMWDLIPEKTITFNRRDGITLNNLKYNYDKWKEFIRDGQEITVKYTRSDIRFIWWMNPKTNTPVCIWAKRIKFGDKIYTSNQIKRLPSISDLQLRDMQNFPFWKMGIELAEKYERIVNSSDNIYYSIYKHIPKTMKDITKLDKNIARNIEEGRIEEKEVKELTATINENQDEFSSSVVSSKEEPKLPKIKKEKNVWNEPIEIKTINLPPKKLNPFFDKKIKIK